MITERVLLKWVSGCGLIGALGAGCGDNNRPSNVGGMGGGPDASGGVAGSQTGGGGSGGAVNTEVGTLPPPPAPPTSDVPEPGGSVTTPNLRVLPWAGFKAAMTYTFDDSQPSQLEHWAELKATETPVTFFINPSNNWQAGYDDIMKDIVASGGEIGNHTWTHCHADLSACTPVGTQEQEIDQASTYIISHVGVPAVASFAAPFGEVGWNQYASPRFLLGRGVVGGFVPPAGQADWYNLPAVGIVAGQTATNFNATIDLARSQGRWGIFLFHSILPTANNWYAGVEIADITTSITYANSLKDVWVSRMADIGAYSRAQQMFEKLPSGSTWTWTLPDHFPKGGVLRVTVDGGSLSQGGTKLAWDSHGYYEVSLDAGTLDWSP